MGVVHGVHTFLPLLLEQDEGHIVNTASLAGLGGVAGLGIYCTTKFAVVGLERVAALRPRGARQQRSACRCCARVRADADRSIRRATRRRRCATGPTRPTRRRRARWPNALAAAGIPPAVVADAVFDAIVERRFFIVPHEHAALATTRARLEWMEGGDPPQLDASRAVQP